MPHRDDWTGRRDFLRLSRRQTLLYGLAACGLSVGADVVWGVSGAPRNERSAPEGTDQPGMEPKTDPHPLQPILDARSRGLVWGTVLGDALGGPVEFQTGPLVREWLIGARDWPSDRRIELSDLEHWSRTLALHPYGPHRPKPEPYGQWSSDAAPGTVTDDTRHKMVLLKMLRRCANSQIPWCDADELADAYLNFRSEINESDPDWGRLNDEAFREYRMAARWLLGERDLEQARPVERLWAGIDNCSGQMLLFPLAAIYGGHPELAYRAAFTLDFVDAPGARDMAAALVAGLAGVLGEAAAETTELQRWNRLFEVMRAVDPLRFSEVPFAGRPLHRWMDLAFDLADRADGRPGKLFELLETEARPLYWWDAHFTLLVPIAMIHFCRYQPLAALHLILDFGHDTDSYAQVLGAMVGAVCGEHCFAESMRSQVASRMRLDYGEDLEEWCLVLAKLKEKRVQGEEVIRMDGWEK